ncbi:uncharacterized protein Dana_GF13533 [Drosophila ananassae]|uniref:Uncharacterized protein n=2 Tax=Drosophila ananassae TaxID=7217 RepID=B3MEI3_DROAN|nr:cilia- and flagella-associated protein 61 isoform X1 [Drosophila ananassae]EDV37603.1 uncharacterized protein Dana_GF13533 [Drosophila ananassae]
MSDFAVRWALLSDQDSITALIRSPGSKWFGNIRQKFLGKDSVFHNYQTHRMVAQSVKTSKLVAYAEFRTYPAISAMPNDCWLEWLSVRYCLPMPISLLNTLFFNFCIYKSECPEVLAEILQEVFYLENKATYFITVRMPFVKQQAHLQEYFEDLEKLCKVFYPREYSINNNFNTQSLYIVDRGQMLPKITYRKALAEDNDEIIAIQEAEMPELREELGDFYIAEELMHQEREPEEEGDLLVVAEMNNKCQETELAIFLWMTTNFDIRFYVRNYEMGAFGNLVKFDTRASFHYETLTVSSVHRRAAASMFTTDALDDLDAMTIVGGLQRNDSGMSVASVGKMKVSSIGGTIEDAHVSNDNKFYMREVLYSKFKNILEKLHSLDYYLRQESNTINFMYNAKSMPPGRKAIQDASNAFLVKCVMARQDFPLPRLFNAVVAMFCAYPDKDYGMMVIPKRAKAIRSHMEVLQYFIPVAMRPSDETNLEEVFITHRSTIFGEISLYKLQKEDVSVVHSLSLGNTTELGSPAESDSSSVSYCSKVNLRAEVENELVVLDAIMKDVLENEFSDFYVFTIRCGNSTKPANENTSVGFVVVRQFHDHSKLYDHYNLSRREAHLDRLRAEIISLRLHPLFIVSSGLILRELAKKTNFYDFYFITSFSHRTFSNDLKKMMMVLEPRAIKKAPVFFEPHKNFKKATPSVNLPTYNFSKDHLIIYRHRLFPVKWFTNNSRLVIIGFSSLAKAFLRKLIFQWNRKDQNNRSNFTCLSWVQVTVICSPGIVEAEYDSLFQCPYCSNTRKCYLSFNNHSCYIRDCCVRMDLRFWVHFVPGVVEFIERDKKFVKLQACEILYDTLICLCSQDFTIRAPDESSLKKLPCNFVEVNFRLNKFMLYYKVRALLEEVPRTYLIVIYGNDLCTYECISFLIDHGVDHSRLVLVQPHRYTGYGEEDRLKNPFWDSNIQVILDDLLSDNGMNIYNDFNFHHWVVHESSDFIMDVVFQHFPSRRMMTFECDLFISFDEGKISYQNKQLFISSNLEMEGDRLLVGENFQTSDPNIYAAGAFVKIRQEVNYQYRYTSEMEIAGKLLHHLGISPKRDYEDRYSQPLHFQAMLPMNYFITKVVMPRRYLNNQLPSSMSCSMTTYKNNIFCRVGLSMSMVVDEIVVVTKQSAHFDFLQHFVGKHELLLNNLRSRYRAKTIDCFITFFQEPWTELIMHDKFEDLQAENRDLLKPMAVSTLTRANVGAFKDVTDMDFVTLNKRYLEHKLLSFLREHRRDFRHRFALPEDFFKSDLPMWLPKPETTEKPEEDIE